MLLLLLYFLPCQLASSTVATGASVGGAVRAQGDTEKIGKMLEKAMMQRVGPAALKQHFVIMDTICDATQFRQDAVYDLVGHQEQARPPPHAA